VFDNTYIITLLLLENHDFDSMLYYMTLGDIVPEWKMEFVADIYKEYICWKLMTVDYDCKDTSH